MSSKQLNFNLNQTTDFYEHIQNTYFDAIMMLKKSILHIGLDDTDSPNSMCTTFLAYKIVNYLKTQTVEFLDYPCLIRLNPNIPWKTRGNGAVSLSIKTSNPEKIKKKIKQLVVKYSDIDGGANPGLAFYQNEKIPKNFVNFSQIALWKLISRKNAIEFVKNNNLDFISLGNGQGLVGAISAIGYKFDDHTYELISYRRKAKFGKKRKLKKENVKKMQEKTFPNTFNSYDFKKRRILITPHGPDPVFYGIRGENASSVIKASKMIKPDEKLAGYLTFKTNQGTGAHLKNELGKTDLKPYTSGIISGFVSKSPKIIQGGHVIFEIKNDHIQLACAVYHPTKITHISSKLIIGDKIRVGGGLRKASKNHPRVLNVEFIKIVKLEKNFKLENPFCYVCKKKMKSKGKNQDFQCIKCGKKHSNKKLVEIPREIKETLYVPSISAYRHLTRPQQRIRFKNKENQFDNKIQWFHVFTN